MSKTTIQWTDYSWNPIIGCKKISPGCQNCYAEKMANRIAGMSNPASGRYKIVTDGGKWSGATYIDYEILREPYNWKKPRRVFVGSMTDIFYHMETVQGMQDLGMLFEIMGENPHITFQVLTKRASMMQTFAEIYGKLPENVWMGVTVCNQAEANAKIPHLLNFPSSKKFVSIEPILGPIYLTEVDRDPWHINALQGMSQHSTFSVIRHPGIDWVIVGGETGPGSRKLDPQWVASLWGNCGTYNVPFFFKEWGTAIGTKEIAGLKEKMLEDGTPFFMYKEFPR